MRILDPRDSKRYEVKDLEIIFHNLPNKDGEMNSTKCVEYNVVGNNSEWRFWMLFSDFAGANPAIAKELDRE